MKKIMFSDKYGLTEAVLNGGKTQTRRAAFDERMQQELAEADAIGYGQGCCQVWRDGKITRQIPSLYKVGEVVAVAQSYADLGFGCPPIISNDENDMPEFASEAGVYNKMLVRADLMPHQIRITNVRVERLQDISDEDCIKEGIREGEFTNTWDRYYFNVIADDICHVTLKSPREAYAALIDRLSGKGTWDKNPFVFAYDFDVIK